MEEALGIVLSISFSVAYIPQIVKMIRRKSSKDVSLIMLLINALGYYCGLGYVLLKSVDAYWLVFNYTAGFIMTFLCIIVWGIYRRYDKNEVKEIQGWIKKKAGKRRI